MKEIEQFRECGDVMNDTPRPGWWTCHLCVPKLKIRDGMDARLAHFMREHYVAPKEKQ